MPSRSSRHFFLKNRSQASLPNIHEANGRGSYQASPVDSPLSSPAFPPSGPWPGREENGDQQSHPSYAPYRSDETRFYQVGLPSRSHSQRSPPSQASAHNLHQPTIHLVRPSQGQHGTTGDLAIDENPDAYYHQAPLPAPQPQKEEQKKRRFFGLGSSTAKESSTTLPAPAATPQKLGRSISVRTKHHNQQNPSGNVSRPLSQQRWPSASSAATYHQPTGEEEEDSGAGLPPSYPGPSIADDDSVRPSEHPTSQQDHSYGGSPAPHQAGITYGTSRPHSERQGSATSPSLETSIRPIQHHHHHPQSEHNQVPPLYQSSPSSVTSTSSHPLGSRAHQDIQHHYNQGNQNNNRPPSQQSYGPPSPLHSQSRFLDSAQQSRLVQNQVSPNSHSFDSMAPPTSQQARDRRSIDLAHPQQNQQGGASREAGGYQPYQQNSQNQNHPPGPPPQYGAQLGVNNPQSSSYRGAQPSPMPQQTTGEQGRSTPPPSRSRDDLANLDIMQLVARHDELRTLAFINV